MSTPYHGNCHCGRYRFELVVPKIEGAVACTCSLCLKKGYLWLPVPPAAPETGGFKVVRDEGSLSEYRSAVLRDKFCSHCGTGLLGEHLAGPLQGQSLVNVRAIQGVNPFELDTAGKTVALLESREPATAPLSSSSPLPPVHHAGSCHCGKVSVELLTPIEEVQVKEDNCSSCVRNAYIGAYPTKTQVRIHGREHTFEYVYGRRYMGTAHCRTCGVAVFANVYGPPPSVFDSVPPESKERVLAAYHRNMALQPVNVRVLHSVDVASLRIQRTDEGTDGYVLDP